jgi:hypothetical protein
MLLNTGDAKLYQTASHHKTIDLMGCLKGKMVRVMCAKNVRNKLLFTPFNTFVNFEINDLIK